MPVTRYLGAGWAAVHGPSAPRDLAIWTLERSFRGVLPAPAARPIDWAALRRVVHDLPFDLSSASRLSGVAEADERVDRGLGSKNRGDVLSALTAIRAAASFARSIGQRRLLLEPGAVRLVGEAIPIDLADADIGWTPERLMSLAARREAGIEAALDGACRVLHGLLKEFPDMEFCLLASRCVDGVASPRGLEAIFEDLDSPRLGYWHEAAIAACRADRLGEPQGVWLERFANRMRGLTVSDWADRRLHLPPGSGLVDYPLVANYVPLATGMFPVVVELEPGVPPGELPGVHSFLDKFGL